MKETGDLRAAARELQQASLSAVDPAAAVRCHLRREGATLVSEGKRYDLSRLKRTYLAAIGKAAVPMADAAAGLLGNDLTAGVVVTKVQHYDSARVCLPEAITVVEAGHPIPDENSLLGARAIVDLLQRAGRDDLVLFLVSGGGSALMSLPVNGITLESLRSLTGALLRSGATIGEINTVRKHLSQVKGGHLARIAHPARVLALVLSDVVGDPLDMIASGPAVPDPTSVKDAEDVLLRYGDPVPGVGSLLCETPKPGDPVFSGVRHLVVGSNRQAALAAAKRATELGFNTLLLGTFVEGEAREVARVAAGLAKSVRVNGDPVSPPACLVMGGETTVTIRGTGKGGRNQELALAAALALEGWSGLLVLALASDGGDGPTDAAGAVITGETVARARALGIDARAALANNDSYLFFDALGDLVKTGPTGTNVNDLLFVLVR
jgi:hydroxypyruvate reductase